jgi:hypothetical protein
MKLVIDELCSCSIGFSRNSDYTSSIAKCSHLMTQSVVSNLLNPTRSACRLNGRCDLTSNRDRQGTSAALGFRSRAPNTEVTGDRYVRVQIGHQFLD